MCMGVNRQHKPGRDHLRRCPHVHGGEPEYLFTLRKWERVVPMCMGVNRTTSEVTASDSTLSPCAWG